MKILLGWSSIFGDYQTKKLIRALKNKSHEVVYWIGMAKDPDDEFPETVFQDYDSARLCLPVRGIELPDFLPPDETLIEKLYKEESLVLTMMNKQFDWMCVDERRHLYYRMLSYWNGIMKKYNPDLIILSSLPHAPFEYVIYALAKLYNIKIIMFDGIIIGIPLGDRKIMFVDSWQKSAILTKTIEKNKGENFSLKDLSRDLQNYYLLHMTESTDPAPIYLKDDKKLNSFSKILFRKMKIILRSIKDRSIFEKAFSRLFKLSKGTIQQEYQSFQKEADMAKKFVYLPLNYQPECTTSPQGDMFADQILMIETISASLPAGWLLYVKEHPAQWFPRGSNFFSSRYRGYYTKIVQLKNVRLIPVETDHYALIRNAGVVATVTGTAGFEGILRGKPVIVFGYPWYMSCHGVFKVNGVALCKKALEEIIGGFQIEQQQVINFLKSFDEATFHGNETIEDMHCKKLNIKERKSMNNIINAILEILPSIQSVRNS